MKVKIIREVRFEKIVEIPDEDLLFQGADEWIADHE